MLARVLRRSKVAVFALAAVEGVGFLIDPSIFRRELGARYAASAEMSGQAGLIVECRSVNDGNSPKTVR
jgi:hypothetical protein